MRYDCVPRTQINTKRNQSIHRNVECSQIDWFILNTRLFDNVTQALSWILKALGIPSTLCGGRLVSRILLFSIPQPPSPAKYSCSQDTITTSFSVRNVRKQKKPPQVVLVADGDAIICRISKNDVKSHDFPVILTTNGKDCIREVCARLPMIEI